MSFKCCVIDNVHKMKSSHIAPFRGRSVCTCDYVCMSVTASVCLCVGVWFDMHVWVHVCGCVNGCVCMCVWLCDFCVCVHACEVSEKGEDNSFENLHETHLGDWIEWALVIRQDHRQTRDFCLIHLFCSFDHFFFLWISESTPELSDFEVVV